MIVSDAKAVARRWVMEEGVKSPGFSGAFFHGSVNWLADDAELPATSDIDVMIVVAGPEAPPKLGKFRYRDVLLEVPYLPSEQVRSAEEILAQSHLAGSFAAPSIIADPSGHLTALQAAVAKEYPMRRWVVRRCAYSRDKVLRYLDALDDAGAFHDQVTAWLFATGITTHVLLVAGLRNPTVRRRYVAVRELLAAYDHDELYEPLLALLGCARMSAARAEQHLAALADAFDAAVAAIRTPFFFASDISDVGRPLAIDGSRELIARGDHREAVFWIVATYARCQKVLCHDAPAEVYERFDPAFRRLLGDLGITTFADLQRRGEQVRAFLPRVWATAEAIIAANPEIVDEHQSGETVLI